MDSTTTFPAPSWRCLAPTLLGCCDLDLGDVPGGLLGCANGHRWVRDLSLGAIRQVEDVAALADEVAWWPTSPSATPAPPRPRFDAAVLRVDHLARFAEMCAASAVPDGAAVNIVIREGRVQMQAVWGITPEYADRGA